MSPSFVSWIVVAVALIVAETLVVYLLRRLEPEISVAPVYLVGVLAVSSVWGPALGVVTVVLIAAVIGLSYVLPSVDFVASDPQWLASVGAFAGGARSRGDGERC